MPESAKMKSPQNTPAARARAHTQKQNRRTQKSHNTIPRDLSVALGSVRVRLLYLPNHKQTPDPATL